MTASGMYSLPGPWHALAGHAVADPCASKKRPGSCPCPVEWQRRHSGAFWGSAVKPFVFAISTAFGRREHGKGRAWAGQLPVLTWRFIIALFVASAAGRDTDVLGARRGAAPERSSTVPSTDAFSGLGCAIFSQALSRSSWGRLWTAAWLP